MLLTAATSEKSTLGQQAGAKLCKRTRVAPPGYDPTPELEQLCNSNLSQTDFGGGAPSRRKLMGVWKRSPQPTAYFLEFFLEKLAILMDWIIICSCLSHLKELDILHLKTN